MSPFIESFHDQADRLAAATQPVLLALGTAGLSGGALTAIALAADRLFHHGARSRSSRTGNRC